ncbi:MAG: flagellar filament capping protein FliD [Planctomycetes bacterium]|nr:flagellar filament capping protein FliD [Planctomycetota bacterium]
MAGIPGLSNASGIDTETVIAGILSRREQAIVRVQDRIAQAEDEKRGFLDINSRLLNIQEVSRRLYNGTSFNTSIIKSSKPDALLATGNTSAFEGTFSFFTKALASASQYVSRGFQNPTFGAVTQQAGTITIETGDSRVNRTQMLDDLNGSSGVDRGEIRITDDAGRSTVIDLSTAISIDEVIELINSNSAIQVTARINDQTGSGMEGDGLIIENASGVGNIRIENVGLGQTATTLGIEGQSAFGMVVGSRINSIGNTTLLSDLNDGRGINNYSFAGSSITINGSGGATNVDLFGLTTVGQLLERINTSGSTVTAAIGADGNSIEFTDSTPPFAVTITGATALLNGLGIGNRAISDTPTANVRSARLNASMNSVLLSSLGGQLGNGISGTVAAPSSFEVIDSNGSITTINLTGREDLYSVVNQINNPIGPGANVLAKLTPEGTGIQLIDRAGGIGQLTVNDLAGTAAADLGIQGTFANNMSDGSNLNFAFLFEGQALSDYGFDVPAAGQIEVVLRNGTQERLDISNARTVGDIVSALNTIASLSVSVNSTGDGFTLNDLSGGTGPLVIRDLAGTFARRLGLRGTYSDPGIVQARSEYTIDVDTNDTLNDVVSKIQGLDIPVVASIVNDGSTKSPHRLSITGRDSGLKNDVVVYSDLDAFSFSQTSVASDALLLYGSSTGSSDPVLLRSNNNTFKNVLSGVTLDMLDIATGPVTVTVNRDLNAAANDITELVDTFNSLAERLDELTGFNVETETAGPLLGDSTLSGLEYQLFSLLNDPVDGLPGGINSLISIGIDINSEGRFEVDSDALLTALEERLEDVRDIFANEARLVPDTELKSANRGEGIKTSDDGNDIVITFADGSANLELDLTGVERMSRLLELFNADPRLEAEISPDSKRLVIRDLTTGGGVFSIGDLNDSGTVASLGFSRSQAVPGDSRLETRDFKLDQELGIGRRVDAAITGYTSSSGLIEDATDAIDERIKRFNEDVERIAERIDAERERLEAQFAAMEAALAESQSTSDILKQQFDRNKDDDN